MVIIEQFIKPSARQRSRYAMSLLNMRYLSQPSLLITPLGARNQIQRTNSTTGKGSAPLTSPACSPPDTTPWCSSPNKQVHVALINQNDEISPLFYYSTRLSVPENKPNGQIISQKNLSLKFSCLFAPFKPLSVVKPHQKSPYGSYIPSKWNLLL